MLLAVLCAAAAAGGAVLAAGPVGAALTVAGAALLQVPFQIRSSGSASMLPVLVAVCAAIGAGVQPATVAAWVIVGFAVVTALARILRVAAPPEPIGAAEAWRHAIATAVLAGSATLLTVSLAVPHGYWSVVAVAAVLRPVPGETVREGRARSVGTAAGVVAAVAVVLVVSRTPALVLAVLCLFLSVAWGLARRTTWAAACSAACVVLIGSAGLVGQGAAVALERLVLIVGGCAVAVAAAEVLDRFKGRRASPGAGSGTQAD